MTPEEVLERHERRERRDAYRAAGGSKRRPLHSFQTDREKREAREAHAARIHAAVAELAEPIGFERFAESMALNPQLSPMNAALVALQTPGEIVGTSAQWKRNGYKVRKGERAAGRITGRNFWPTAYFTAEQAAATDLEEFEPELPPDDVLEAMRAKLAAFLGEGVKGTEAVEAVAAGLRGEMVPDLQPKPPRRPEKPPEERLEAVSKRMARLERERAAIDREIAALVKLAPDTRGLTVQGIADAVGLSRQRLYQIAGAE